MCILPQLVRSDPKNHASPLLEVPCNQCPECLVKRATNWATRVGHELSLSPDNIFATFTYDDAKASSYSLDYTDFQKFLKVLRKANEHKKIKYLASIEHGGQHGRLHYHAILFNYYPSITQNEKVWSHKTSPSGYPLFRSTQLEKYWTHGFSSFSPASIGAAYYIASYALKSQTYVNKDGEILSDKMRCSNGIGLNYFRKHYKQILAEAKFNERSINRYYQKKLKELHPDEYDQFIRYRDALNFHDSNDAYARLVTYQSRNKHNGRSTKEYAHLHQSLNPLEFSKELSRRKQYEKNETCFSPRRRSWRVPLSPDCPVFRRRRKDVCEYLQRSEVSLRSKSYGLYPSGTRNVG